ncbi:MAG: hypothetical protein LUE92_06440 [Clostridiales bacterium]|nr:hypothetical protein [Clostridiales bacterium]
MQVHTMMLGGLEPSYMRKLALYLTSRLGEQVTVGIVDNPCACEDAVKNTVWVGSEQFLSEVRGKGDDLHCILLSEENEADGSVFRYQSCEKLYQGIMFLYRQMEGIKPEGVALKQKWLVFTTDQDIPSLMAFSTVCAHILRETAEVLYLSFSECTGMERVFLLEEGTDLADLLMALRESGIAGLDASVRRMAEMDYVLPPVNPMILHEIREEDITRLIQAAEQSASYRYVVVMVGTSCCGIEQFFRRAYRVFHLTGRGGLAECSRQEWQRFIRLCLGERQVPVEQIVLPDVKMETCGEHLIHEWTEGELGQIARKYLAGDGMNRPEAEEGDL